MQKIVLEPSEVWKYYTDNKVKLENSVYEIASNDEFGIEIDITVLHNKLNVAVFADFNEVYSETIYGEDDCKYTINEIYEEYLTDKVFETLYGNVFGLRSRLSSEIDGPDDTSSIEKDMIDERELDLDDAVHEFLYAVCSGEYAADFVMDIDDNLVEDVKDHFLEYLAREWEIPIYRPMYLEDEDGEVFFEEYPYDCMVFEEDTK